MASGTGEPVSSDLSSVKHILGERQTKGERSWVCNAGKSERANVAEGDNMGSEGFRG